ncbi:MAG: nucleoside monophosphate kinase, partial [Erysipelotrichaceae bacterium]|nr:nucleoside monophosphate kinase [Erysipelotrichaceae bacterium]
DGYPRTKAQAEDLSQILKQLNKKIDAVINLDISDEDLVKRITGRRLCPACGEIYNIYFKKPSKEGICDKCGAELIQRKDDNLESLETRLSEYHKNTQPLIEYYEGMDLVKHTDASKGVDVVFEEIRSFLEGLC